MRHVLISGGSRGIGKAIADIFLENNYNVTILYSSNYDLDMLYGKFNSEFKDRIFFIRTNVALPVEVNKSVSLACERFGEVDILISNSGISKVGLSTDFIFEDYREIMDVNFGGLFNLCHEIVPQMVHNKRGAILAISSMWGARGASCEALYSASKGAVDAYIKSLAKELGPSGIRVNAVAPGVIDTDMMATFGDEAREELASETPLGRLGEPKDVARMVFFLTSDEANFVTGQIVGVDGGF